MSRDNCIAELQAISFADGTVDDVKIAGDEVWINFIDWRERRFVIHLTNVALFQTSGTGHTTGGRIRRNSPEIEQILEALDPPCGIAEDSNLLRERLIHLEVFGDGPPTDLVFEGCRVTEALPSTTGKIV